MFKIVEKKNHLAVHGVFSTFERAETHLNKTIPNYVTLGYFTDKTLFPEDFEIILENSAKRKTS